MEVMDLQNRKQQIRTMSSIPFSMQPLSAELLNAVDVVLQNFVLSGKTKIHSKRQTLQSILHQLILAGLTNRTVADSRDTGARFKEGKTFWSPVSVETRISLWDQLIEEGYAELGVRGSEGSKKVTRYLATGKLMELVSGYSVPALFASSANEASSKSNSPFTWIIGRKGKIDPESLTAIPKADQKVPLLLPAPDSPMWESLQVADRFISMINSKTRQYKWEVTSSWGRPSPVDTDLRQIHRNQWGLFSRLYGRGNLHYQWLDKNLRRTPTVDGQPTVELDFSCMLLRMLYHSCNMKAEGDLYQVSPDMTATARSLIKAASIRMLFCKDQKDAVLSIKRDRELKQERSLLKAQQMTVEQLVEQIIDYHRPVARHFFGDIGAKLITKESLIMLNFLVWMMICGIPVLSVHDAIICREADVGFCAELLCGIYRAFNHNYPPEIKRVTATSKELLRPSTTESWNLNAVFNPPWPGSALWRPKGKPQTTAPKSIGIPETPITYPNPSYCPSDLRNRPQC